MPPGLFRASSLIPSTSHVIQCLTQSLSSFRSTCPNHLNLLFLIIKLTGSNPKSSQSSSLFFLSFSLTQPHTSICFSGRCRRYLEWSAAARHVCSLAACFSQSSEDAPLQTLLSVTPSSVFLSCL